MGLNLTQLWRKENKTFVDRRFVYIVIWMNKSVNDRNNEMNSARLRDTLSAPNEMHLFKSVTSFKNEIREQI